MVVLVGVPSMSQIDLLETASLASIQAGTVKLIVVVDGNGRGCSLCLIVLVHFSLFYSESAKIAVKSHMRSVLFYC